MVETKVIIAESSDIMLNGIEDLLRNEWGVQIIGRALKYNQLCQIIEQTAHDIVVLGPMITDKYSHQLMGYLLNRFPEIKIVQINIEDSHDIIMKKIEKVSLSLEV